MEEKTELEDLIAEEDGHHRHHRGYIKRTLDTIGARDGEVKAHRLNYREEDFVEHLVATTHHLMFFSSKGKVYRLKAWVKSRKGRQARGWPLSICCPSKRRSDYSNYSGPGFHARGLSVHGHQRGTVKKTYLMNTILPEKKESSPSPCGKHELVVKFTDGSREMILVTKGYAIRFHEDDVRSMGERLRG